MNKKKLSSTAVFLFFSVFCPFLCFSQEVINPASGVWANRQMLALDVPPGSSAYYSLSGNDPEASGFAYDGPVLIDVEGDILLKVTIVNAEGGRFRKDIAYTVKNAPYPGKADEYQFIKDVVDSGLIDYTAGETLSIPSSLEYSMGELADCFENGKNLAISEKIVASRYIPCTVTDGSAYWRFLIRVNPVMTGVYSRRDVPFEISGWDTVSFSNKKCIYKIDDGWWEQPRLPVKIDRSESHMISWQPVEYSAENTVRFFVLPPKPQIHQQEDVSGAVSVSYSGEPGYKFGLIQPDGSVMELYDSFEIDTFQGDLYEGTYRTGVFYDSVYQGDFEISYSVNKKVPPKPVIESSAQNHFSRRLVTVNVRAQSGTDVYVSVAGPVIVESDSSADVLFSFDESDFKKWKGGEIVLHPSNEGAVAYKVFAYAEDAHKNRSLVSDYDVVIDTCNYYVDEKSSAGDSADGTKARPYTSFAELLPFISENRFITVFLSGRMEMPQKATAVSSNLQIIGQNDGRIVFPPNASLAVRNASLAITDCVISYAAKQSRSEESEISATLLHIERGVLDLKNVELSAAFAKNGTVINAENSVVIIEHSGITSSADSYSSVLAAVDSKINIRNSTVTTVAGTSINFSAQGGIFDLRATQCKVVGVMGRIAELFDTQSSISDNMFYADLKKRQPNTGAVYTDSKNMSVVYSGNSETGF